MTPPPRPFRLVYRTFDRIEFDRAKSDEIFEWRGFDLAYVSRIFPGYVLESEDTRPYPEPRHQVIGELLGEVFFVVYTRRRLACRLIRPGSRNRLNGSFGMTSHNNRPAVVDVADRNRGQIDQTRLGRPNASDTEERPAVTAHDAEATRTELHDLKRRMTRRTA